MSGEHICRENIAQAKKENPEPPTPMTRFHGRHKWEAPRAYPVTVGTAAALGKD